MSKARHTLWLCQWFAVILLPIWVVWGTVAMSGDGWIGLILAVFLAPLLLLFLLIAGLLSIGIRSSRRAHGGPWYVWLMLGVWITVAVQPFFIPTGGDAGPSPSVMERIGLSVEANNSFISVFFWTSAVLLALAWIATGTAGSVRPFGDGSDRVLKLEAWKSQRRLDEANQRQT